MLEKIKRVFECKMCGECCRGSGGIIVGPEEIERISSFLRITPEEFKKTYLVKEGKGKYSISCGKDGYCVFFSQTKGCRIHHVKPDICRAWPFFKGNLLDEVSLEMAKRSCPGIRREVSLDEFRAIGIEFLRSHSLIKKETYSPNALKIE